LQTPAGVARMRSRSRRTVRLPSLAAIHPRSYIIRPVETMSSRSCCSPEGINLYSLSRGGVVRHAPFVFPPKFDIVKAGMKINLIINGKKYSGDVEPRLLLIHY